MSDVSRLVRVPSKVLREAEKYQRELAEKGIRRPLWECLQMTRKKKEDDVWKSFRL